MNIKNEKFIKDSSLSNSFKNRSFYGKIRFLITFNSRKRKYDKFELFIKGNLVDGKKPIAPSELASMQDQYSSFVAGSDQVWNLSCSGNALYYFLDFVTDNEKKFSYAASFGVSELPEYNKPIIKELLSSFKQIIVREKQGAIIVKDLLGIDVPVVLDPTLLLDRKQWINKIKSEKCKDDYVLIYCVQYSSSIIQFAKILAEEKNMQLIMISESSLTRLKGVHCIGGVGPREWVDMFDKASYIVTNSFHGIAFSINFNKQFFVELLPQQAAVNSRLEDMLDMFSLRARLIIDGKNDHIDSIIDYSSVNDVVDYKRSESLQYLHNIMEKSNSIE